MNYILTRRRSKPTSSIASSKQKLTAPFANQYYTSHSYHNNTYIGTAARKAFSFFFKKNSNFLQNQGKTFMYTCMHAARAHPAPAATILRKCESLLERGLGVKVRFSESLLARVWRYCKLARSGCVPLPRSQQSCLRV